MKTALLTEATDQLEKHLRLSLRAALSHHWNERVSGKHFQKHPHEDVAFSFCSCLFLLYEAQAKYLLTDLAIFAF